ncbi:hypothetical protein D9M73_151220 [compost metagenome]
MRLRETSSGQGGGCSGLMPAATSTELNSRNSTSRVPMRQARRCMGMTCQSTRSSRMRVVPSNNGDDWMNASMVVSGVRGGLWVVIEQVCRAGNASLCWPLRGLARSHR